MLRRFVNISIGVMALSCLLITAALVGIPGFSNANHAVALASSPHFIVAQDGSGDYKTVQAAVDAVPSNNPNHIVIYIKNGTYQEVVTVPSNKPYITFFGQDEKNTIITYNNYHGKPKPGGGTYGTGDSASVFIQANNFSATNITFQNTAGAVGQAVAINVTGDRAIFDSCQFLGWQDTLYANTGRQYYENSYITGRVDYVFGDATAVFENTEFYNVASTGGTVTAQKRSSASETTGYVLVNDKIDGALADSTYLGRPWGPYGRVIVMDSWIGSDIRAQGWENWSTADYHLTAYFAEYNNTGPGSNTSGRISWSHQLTAQQAQQYSVNNFLNQDGWLTSAEQSLNALIAAGFGGNGSTPTPIPSPTPTSTPTPTPTNTPTPTPTPTNTPTPTPTPTNTPTPTPTPTNTPTPTPTSGSSCSVSYVVQNQWPTGFTTNLTITNTGSTAINGWTLAFAFPGSQQITQGWSGTFSQSGNQVTVKDAGYNASIAPGSSTSLGFNGSLTGSNPNPTAFTLNGAKCS